MNILGIPIDNMPRTAVLERVRGWLAGEGFHRIATVNPEFLLLAQRSAAFKEALLAADLRLADGVGLHFPFWLAGEKFIGHYPGVDLMCAILELAEAKDYGVALALHEHGLSSSEQICRELQRRYPKLPIGLWPSEGRITNASGPILHTSYFILLSNLGAPLQEISLESFRTENTGIRLAMGVGGAFDYLTGAMPRAPKVLRRLGFEWLWRLWQQPRRFRRIWNAVVVFPIRVLFGK